jgi:hypothetical protein
MSVLPVQTLCARQFGWPPIPLVGPRYVSVVSAMSCMLWAITFGPVSFHQKVRVVGRHHVIEHRQTERFFASKTPAQLMPSVMRKR